MSTRTARRHYGAVPSAKWMSIYRGGRCRICDTWLAKGDRAFWDGHSRTLTCTDESCITTAGLDAPTTPAGRTIQLQRPARVNLFERCNHVDAPCCGCGQ